MQPSTALSRVILDMCRVDEAMWDIMQFNTLCESAGDFTILSGAIDPEFLYTLRRC